MATKDLYLKSTTLKYTATHSAPASPPYTATISLNPNTLKLTVTFRDPGYANFNFPVGIKYKGDGGSWITKKTNGNFSFGYTYGNFGYGVSKTITANLSNLEFPITLRFTCMGCSSNWTEMHEWQNNLTIKIHDARIPDPPVIVRTTGKTIRVTSDAGHLYCKTTSDGWYDQKNHTFTGLTQGTQYEFICKDDNGTKSDKSVKARTWNISGSFNGGTTNSLTFVASHTAGTKGKGDPNNGDADDHKITYKLFTTKNASGTPVKTKEKVTNGTAVTFSGLNSGTTYYCYAYTVGLKNNSGDEVIDNTCWIEGTTKSYGSVQGNGNGDVSATTLRTTLNWSSGDAISSSCTFTCNGVSRTIYSSGKYVGFTGLNPDTTYTIYWRVVNIYQYTYIDPNTNKEVTNTETKESTGYFTLRTKKAFFVNVNTSSKIIQFSSKSNYDSDVMEQKLDSGSWYTINQNTNNTHTNLTHNTSHTIYSRIKNCYAFDVNGNKTNTNDSTISKSQVNTKRLSLSGSLYSEHQHSLITSWQAYVNNNITDKDSIDGYLFNFSSIITKAKKSNPPYQAAEVIENNNGDGYTHGDYQYDKKVYSDNLTWYYCEYIVTATITDGYNKVSASVIAHTIFPAAWIYSGGQWHRYMGHVYTNGKWVPAPVFVYNEDENKYIEPNGE